MILHVYLITRCAERSECQRRLCHPEGARDRRTFALTQAVLVKLQSAGRGFFLRYSRRLNDSLASLRDSAQQFLSSHEPPQPRQPLFPQEPEHPEHPLHAPIPSILSFLNSIPNFCPLRNRNFSFLRETGFCARFLTLLQPNHHEMDNFEIFGHFKK